ncbi:hypothetical protein ACROSR_10160 [Roseovarius tibetensis]|uniref:hypothetical protein n=1 Tax=Roseovarius tibetensis TaxID=2685897 RepID=UPI003D7F2840
MDFSKLIKPEWVFRSETAGNWDVYPYSVKAMKAIEEHLQEDKSHSKEGIRALIGSVCKRHIPDGEEQVSAEPTEDELEQFTDADIEKFSREFLEHGVKLIKDSEEPLVKHPDQTNADFLIEVLAAENRKHSARLGETFSRLKSRLGGILGTENLALQSVTRDLLKQNQNLERAYGSVSPISSPRAHVIKAPRISETPAEKTNKHLTNMNARLDNLIGFGEQALQKMHGLEVAAAEFLGQFSDEASKNSKAAKAAIIVGGLAVIISLGQIAYTEYRRVPQDTAAMKAALASIRGDIDELKTALSAELANS